MTEERGPDQIREDIEATREELGDTVEALAAKTDVKAQAQQKLDETKAQASARKDEFIDRARQISPESAVQAATGAQQKARENPLPVAAAGGFVLGFLIGRVTSKPDDE